MGPEYPKPRNLGREQGKLLFDRYDNRACASITSQERRCVLALERIQGMPGDSVREEAAVNVQQSYIVHIYQPIENIEHKT